MDSPVSVAQLWISHTSMIYPADNVSPDVMNELHHPHHIYYERRSW